MATAKRRAKATTVAYTITHNPDTGCYQLAFSDEVVLTAQPTAHTRDGWLVGISITVSGQVAARSRVTLARQGAREWFCSRLAAPLKRLVTDTALLALEAFLDKTERRLAAERMDAAVAAAAAAKDAPPPGFGMDRPPDGSGSGRAIAFEAITPWPESVDGAALLTDIAATLKRFIAMADVVADTSTLLVVNAHVHEASDISPIGVLSSPLKRCGKTTLLRFVLALTPRALASSNVTAPAVFRVIEAYNPTFIIDEVDSFLALKEELRGVLNAGHTRDLAYVIRTVGDDHEPRRFTTWCPKFFALIGQLPSTLQDRSIVLPMRRRAKGEKAERLKKRQPRTLVGTLPERLARWAADHLGKLREHDALVPEVLDDRQGDNWEPLLAIADLAGGDWPERAGRAALALSGVEDQDPDHDEVAVAALRDVGVLLRQARDGRMSSAEMVARLTADHSGRWVEYGRTEKPITQRQLARLLAPFGIKPKVMRIGDKTPSGYQLDDFSNSLSRYIPPVVVPPADLQHPQHSNENAVKGPASDPQQPANVGDRKTASHPHKHEGVEDVGDPQQGAGMEGSLWDSEAPPDWVTDPDDPSCTDKPEGAELATEGPIPLREGSALDLLAAGFGRSTGADRSSRWLEAAGDLQAEVLKRVALGDPLTPEGAIAFLLAWGLLPDTAEWLYGARRGKDWQEGGNGTGRVVLLPLDAGTADAEAPS
jgi:hypothetical protein